MGVKTAGCFPGDEHGRAWVLGQQPCFQGSHPRTSALPLLPAPLPSTGLCLAMPPSIPGLGIGLAVPACPLLVRKGPRVGGQPPQSRLMSECEDYWLLPRRRTCPSQGTPAAGLFPGVTSASIHTAPLPSLGLGLATISISWPGSRIGCTRSSMLCPKKGRKWMSSHPEAAF